MNPRSWPDRLAQSGFRVLIYPSTPPYDFMPLGGLLYAMNEPDVLYIRKWMDM